MRKIEIIVPAEVPIHRVAWFPIADNIRAQWAQMGLKPFSGSVAVGYTWFTARGSMPSWQRSSRVWQYVVKASFCCLAPGTQPGIGLSRFVKAEQPQVRITIEEVT